jgi:hypothetical protein
MQFNTTEESSVWRIGWQEKEKEKARLPSMELGLWSFCWVTKKARHIGYVCCVGRCFLRPRPQVLFHISTTIPILSIVYKHPTVQNPPYSPCHQRPSPASALFPVCLHHRARVRPLISFYSLIWRLLSALFHGGLYWAIIPLVLLNLRIYSAHC